MIKEKIDAERVKCAQLVEKFIKNREKKPDDPDDPIPNRIYQLEISKISPNPNQPRKNFDSVALTSLADSIRKHGLLQPVTVRIVPDQQNATKFELISGERRLRAVEMLGEKFIAARILDVSPEESSELAIIENLMRSDLDIFEYADGLRKLISEHGLTQESLAERLSVSQSNIANKLRVLKLSERERAVVRENRLTERHARAILTIDDEELRYEVLREAAEKNLNVSETERLVSRRINESSVTDEDLTSAPRRIKYFIKDVRIFCNTIDKAVESMRSAGIVATAVKNERDDGIEIVISIPKSDPKQVMRSS